MALVPSGSQEQASDGSPVTLLDTSNYNVGGNPPAANWARTWVVKNAAGTTLFTLPIPTGQLTVEFANPVDQYYSATLSFVGSPPVSPITIEFGASQIEANMLDARLVNSCGQKCNAKGMEAIKMGFIYFNRAERSVLYTNNGTRFNNFITAANKWLR